MDDCARTLVITIIITEIIEVNITFFWYYFGVLY